ncbi:arginine--tRNA ligase [Candidatus Pacearchaeota archaeon CG10_big_fil_rev_8_21_14_0_10_30_48]|nr:MAG: arginine--tRNA ligase [Candidatus Pacearchaeota archaeon CG10_big_fil_rev_8_21_14_0_10_30_48]
MRDKLIDFLYKKTKLEKEKIKDFLETPPDVKMGDYAFPCFILSKQLKKPPIEIALELKRDLEKKLPDFLERIENKGPYLNFFVDKKMLAQEVLSKALETNYGTQKQKEKILIEHTSVNPNASPHVGRTRNSIIGDSVVRILKFLGNKVEIHYYVNDVSKQIAMLALNFNKKDKFEDMLAKYIEISKKIEKNPELEKQVFDLLKKFESKDKKTTQLFNNIVKICVDGQKKIFKKVDIKFDSFDYESRYVGKASQDLLKKLEKTGKLFKDKDGRMVLNQSNTELIRKMKAPMFVLARSNGTGLYGLRDIAYTIDKSKFGRNIIVLGEDQKLYFEQISEAVKLLGYKAPEVIHYSFVLLQGDKGATKMSTRRGELVLLEEFFEEAVKKAKYETEKRKTKGSPKKIAIAAIKYSMLKNDNDKNIIFDWEQSLRFEGDTGPYLQYSYARASSIIKKSKIKKSKNQIPELSDGEIKLIKKILEFPEVVEKSAEKLNPSFIANYSFQLAQSFNEFYHSNKVIGEKEEHFRIKLVEAFRNTLKNSLYLLGIEVMEEM